MPRAPLVLLVFLVSGCASRAPAPATGTRASTGEAAPACRCTPGKACWPTAEEWRQFGARLHGKIEQPQSPFVPCKTDAAGEACAAAVRNAKNPFALQDQSGATQSTGWFGAWDSTPSAYAVVAADAADIATAVSFARERRLRLVIKGTGHDYLGRSTAPDSLLIWTHALRRVSVDDAFVARGCVGSTAVPAVTVEAGTRWLEAYQEVTVRHGRYVQGGGCTSVGAAGGFLQGGGFGSWSKKFGIAAASMLEAEVVTADGRILVANRCQNQDLFWALRGGGGGTFGVVTQVTLKTHPLPAFFGGVDGHVTAKNDAAFKDLIEQFVLFYRERLAGEHWGEQVRIRRTNTLDLSLVFQGLPASEAQEIWRPFRAFLDAHRDVYQVTLQIYEVPGRHLWDAAFLKEHVPEAIRRDERAGSPADRFWWADDGGQVSAYWYAYQSRWLPLGLFDKAKARTSAEMLFAASRHWSVGLHFNKGQAGASAEALAAGRETAMNPSVFDAEALVIIAAEGHIVPGVSGPDEEEAESAQEGIAAAIGIIRAATPGSGSYVNETDWFEADWQRSFWGENYDRLASIKRKYDPDGLFYCHHCVGSESWSEGGFCKLPP